MKRIPAVLLYVPALAVLFYWFRRFVTLSPLSDEDLRECDHEEFCPSVYTSSEICVCCEDLA